MVNFFEKKGDKILPTPMLVSRHEKRLSANPTMITPALMADHYAPQL